MREDETRESIAIIGMAGRFPGARTPRELFDNLLNGVESIRVHTDAELEQAGIPRARLARPNLVRASANVDGEALFDAEFFGMSPHEAAMTDPQHRILLECAWETFENAGYDPQRYPGLVGVYAGAGMNTYGLHLLSAIDGSGVGESLPLTLGNERDYLATRICYKLGLRGAGVGVQTACSTSLVAVHLACQALLDYDCDMALAGGVSIRAPQPLTYLHEPGGILSPDGHCRAFDADAAGTVFGNGAGLVLLKRLSEAARDRDHIYAVILGSAINNDSNDKVGFTAPSIIGQADVISSALAAADISASTIGYVEAHGTGTPLGDPAEIAALTEAFGARAAGDPRCGIGTLKSNIGHLNAAAGIAGLIKTALVLQSGEIPPSLHFSRPNPRAELDCTPFFVVSTPVQWPHTGIPRRASVSSFGIGGTNAHAVLEQAPPRQGKPSNGIHLMPISARTAGATAERARRLADHLERHGGIAPGDIAFTLQVGRRSFAYRRFVVADDIESAIAGLRRQDAAVDGRKAPPVAFLFPGQGAQLGGMVRSLYDAEPNYARLVDHCARVLKPPLGFDLRDLLTGHGSTNPAAQMRETSIAQPLLFVAEYAAARLLMSWGIRPAAVLGHSLGEITAACVADVLTLDDALLLVAERGRLMQSMPRGAMLLVGLSRAELASKLPETIELAGINSPDACTVGGPVDAVAAFAEGMTQQGIRCRMLETSHAYHTSAMAGAVDAFAAAAQHVTLRSPAVPLLSTSTGGWLENDQARDPIYWARHIREPARLDAMMARLAADPYLMVEVGPTAGLCVLALQHGVSKEHLVGLGDDRSTLLQAMGRLWQRGVDIDWTKVQEHSASVRVPLPSYPFEKTRHWIGPAPNSRSEGTLPRAADASTKRLPVRSWVRSWRKKPLIASTPLRSIDHWLVCGEGELADAVVADAGQRGLSFDRVNFTSFIQCSSNGIMQVDPAGGDSIAALLHSLREKGGRRLGAIHLWAAEKAAGSHDLSTDTFKCFDSLLFLAQRSSGGPSITRLAAVTSGLHRILPGEDVRDPLQALVLGPMLVIPQEDSSVSCVAIDVRNALPGTVAPIAKAILDECVHVGDDRVVGYRAGQRWVRGFDETVLPQPDRIKFDDTCMITGGLGELGLKLAESMVSAGSRKICLISRAAFNLEDADEGKRASIDRMKSRGARVVVCSADVTCAAEIRNAIAHAEQELGPIGCVFHLAGVPGGGLAALKQPEDARRVLAPKVSGTLQLIEALRDHPPRLVLLFSSITSVVGGLGQVDYAAASAFLDALAESGDPAMRIASIAWDAWESDSWQSASSLPSEAKKSLREFRQINGISSEEGWQIIHSMAGSDLPTVVVARRSIEELEQDYQGQREKILAGTLGRSSGNEQAADVATAGNVLREAHENIQSVVAAIWTKVLGISSIAPESDFLELGGHSLSAIQVIGQIHEQLGIEVPLRTLFEHTTLDSFTQALRELESLGSSDMLDEIMAKVDRLAPELAKQLLAAPGLFPTFDASSRPQGISFSLFFFSGDGATERSDKYGLLLDAARFADANGFEAIWTPERHFGQFGGLYPNPSVLGAAIATATKRIQIRAGSIVLPLHDPLRVAEEWSVVDNLSGGRTALAIASGWHLDDFTLFPDRYHARKEYCVAAIEQLRNLWQGQSILRKSVDGENVEVRVFPRPIQKSIPLWLTASAAEETFVAAGELGVNLLTGLTGQSIEELSNKIKSYRAAFEGAGHASGSGRVTLMLHTFIGEDLRKVKEQVRGSIYRYLRDNLELHARQYERHTKKQARLPSADEDALLEHSFDRYFRSGSLLGTVESCMPFLDHLEAIGVNEIACLVDFGLEANEVLGGLDRLASLARKRRR